MKTYLTLQIFSHNGNGVRVEKTIIKICKINTDTIFEIL